MMRGGFLHVALAAAAFLTGCAHSADTVFYTLDPRPPASATVASTYRGPQIQIDGVRLPATLDRPELIRRTGPNTLEVDDFSRWAAPLGELAQRVLTQDLAARLPDGVVIYPGASKPADAGGLTVEILDFGIRNSAGVMDVSWELDPVSQAGQPPVPPVRRTLHLDVPETDTGSKGSADALSRLFAALADDIAGQLAIR